MSRKGRSRRKGFGKMSLVFTSAIVSLSLLGVGYGYWGGQSSMNITSNVSTGNIDPMLDIGGAFNLKHEFSEDNSTVFIYGEIYHDLYEDLTIKVFDNGSIPVKLKGLKPVGISEIVELNEDVGLGYKSLYMVNDNLIEELHLSITPQGRGNGNPIFEISTLATGEEIEGGTLEQIELLKREIQELIDEIERLNVIEKHEFEYELQFIQGI